MLRAVHSDRSGRVIVSDEHSAAASDGARTIQLTETIPMPTGAVVVPLPDREAEAFDRGGRRRTMGRTRWAAAALLPSGHTRTLLPAYRDDPTLAPLARRAYAAVAADADGALVVAATRVPPLSSDAADDAAVGAAVRDGLRERPSNRLVRQLARCAREYRCAAARGAFLRQDECAVVIGTARPEAADAPLQIDADVRALPHDRAPLRPSATEVAEVALAHVRAGGGTVSFGRSCEGDPLDTPRAVIDAMTRIRSETQAGTLHLNTAGGSAAALQRLVASGLGSVRVRIVSARQETYERCHRPLRHRWSDVRASVRAAAASGAIVSLELFVMPGITDLPSETDAVIELLGDVRTGGTLVLRDAAADPMRALALAPRGEHPVGIAHALDRVSVEAPHFRVVSTARPL